MLLTIAERLAQAGMDLACAQTSEQCTAMLVDLAPHLVDGRDAWFVGHGTLSGARVGEVPPGVRDGAAGPSPDLAAGEALPATSDDWIGVVVRKPEPAADWWGELWVRTLNTMGSRRMLQILARQAGVALDLVMQRERNASRERQQIALIEAGKTLTQELSLDGVLHRIIELARDLVDAEFAALGVLDDSGERLAQFITVGVDTETHARIGNLPTGKGVLGVLIHDPHPLRLRRIADDERAIGFPDHHPDMTSFLGVPIVSRRRVKGRIYLTNKRSGSEFTLDDELVVVTLASQAGIALENAELYESVNETAHELARTNAELEDANRHKSAFLANMSHELRSPLNSIIGYTRLLLEDAGNLNDEQVEDLEIIRESGTHLLSLISDLLDLSRIEAGKLALRLGPVDAGKVLEDVAVSIRPQVEAASTVLTIMREGELTITCDRSRLRQMLLNVIGNAVKFTAGGRIDAALVRTGETVTFEVRDTGPGIPPGDLQRIFESFFQSSAALARTPRAEEGAGLGLAITQMLARLHGGEVSIDSELGVGTTVRIVLPVDGPALEEEEEVAPVARAATTTPAADGGTDG